MKRLMTALAALALLAGVQAMAQPDNSKTGSLKVGDPVPEFKLPYATKDTVVFVGIGSKDLLGKRYLLAFYPADWSGGCTKEMCTFRDQFKELEGLNIDIYGVSADLVFSHHEWAKNLGLPFKLLADQARQLGPAMGVYMADHGMMRRSVFVIGPDGKIQYADYNYSVKDDTDLNSLKAFLAKK
jgi:peroxiredoxin